MALVACGECGKEISKQAETCPNCGYKKKKSTSLLTWIVAIVIAVPTLGAIFSGAGSTSSAVALTPEQIAEKSKRDAEVQRASVGASMLKKAARNPDSFKLEQALIMEGTGAVCYDYRAQNGFGGMNAGHAVLSADAKQFKGDNDDGFAKLWNKECANKSGRDVATAITWLVL